MKLNGNTSKRSAAAKREAADFAAQERSAHRSASARSAQSEAAARRAAAPQSVPERAVLGEVNLPAGQIAARYRQMAGLAIAVEPVAEEHHRHPRGAAPARAAVLAEAVQTVQHDVADSLRRDILTLKQECERVEHGGWPAVIFGKLVAQRIFHRGTFFRVAYSYRITI